MRALAKAVAHDDGYLFHVLGHDACWLPVVLEDFCALGLTCWPSCSYQDKMIVLERLARSWRKLNFMVLPFGSMCVRVMRWLGDACIAASFLQTKAQCVLTSAERMGWSRLRHMSIKELCAEFAARITKPPNVQVHIFTTRNLACVRDVLLTCLTMLFLLVVRRMPGYHLSALKGILGDF